MFTLTIKPDEGEQQVVIATARDVLAWERAGSGTTRSVTQLLAETRLVDAYALAYVASKRQGLFEGSQAEFEQTHDLVLGAEPTPDPTRRGR